MRTHSRIILSTAIIIMSVMAASSCWAGDRLKPSGMQPKNEFWIGGSYGGTKDYYYYVNSYYGGPYERTWEVDIWGTQVGFQHYYRCQFRAPGVPIGFIPYDYRTSYIAGAISFDRESIGSWKQDMLGLQATGTHYGKFHFLSSWISYNRQLQYYELKEVSLDMSVGYHNDEILVGLVVPFRWQSTRSYNYYGYDYDYELALQWSGAGLKLEYTPSSLQRFSMTPVRMAKDGRWYYDLPVRYAVTLPDYWVTVQIGAHYYRESRGYARFGPSALVRKYFGDNSVRISGAYDRASVSGYDEYACSFEAGFDLVISRSVTISLSYDSFKANASNSSFEDDFSSDILNLRFSMIY